jgi:hypothetical protein
VYHLNKEALELGIKELLKDKPEQIEACVDAIYDETERMRPLVDEFHKLHMTPACGVVTTYNIKRCAEIVFKIRDRIKDKTVIEVGAGVGLLSIIMANFAKRVYAIEVDPAWAWGFTEVLYDVKPPNLTFIFGKAETMIDILHGDIAVIVTRSGHKEMQRVARKLAKEVIDVYLEYHINDKYSWDKTPDIIQLPEHFGEMG